MMQFVAGWDGGGTKTKVVCMDVEGNPLFETVLGPLNPNGAPEAEVMQTVTAALNWMQSKGECVALVVSVAGISNPRTAALLHQALKDFSAPFTIVGDQESALAGAVSGVGVVLVSGTGSICFGCNAGSETARSGGYGYLVDDEGSGYAIGRDILSAVLRAADGRAPATLLAPLVMAQAAWKDIPTIMHSLYQGTFDKSKVAALAPLLLNTQDDDASKQICRKAALELVMLATAVINKLNLQNGCVALTGSILTHITPIRQAVIQALTLQYPNLKGFEPRADAAHGAAYMAHTLYHSKKGT